MLWSSLSRCSHRVPYGCRYALSIIVTSSLQQLPACLVTVHWLSLPLSSPQPLMIIIPGSPMTSTFKFHMQWDHALFVFPGLVYLAQPKVLLSHLICLHWWVINLPWLEHTPLWAQTTFFFIHSSSVFNDILDHSGICDIQNCVCVCLGYNLIF